MLIYYLVAALASIIAGFINTLTGNGSSVTLAVLMNVVGFSARDANATIRVGVLAATIGALPTFIQKKKINLQRDYLIVIFMTLGAIGGIFLALTIDNDTFKAVFRYLFIFMLLLAFTDTKRWLLNTEEQRRLPIYVIIPLYLFVGFFGGFVQMGVGVVFLTATVLIARYHIIDAGALRTLCVALYTPIAIAIFAWTGLIHWDFALVMAAGEWLGGFLGAKFATTNKNAGIFAQRLLIVLLVVIIIKEFFF